MLHLDWLDAILVSLGFVLWITIGFFLSKAFGVSPEALSPLHGFGILIFVVLPPVGRRLIWGAPNLPEPKDGLFWSLLSMFGLLLSIAGMACFVFSVRWFVESFQSAPDFLKQSREFHAGLKDYHGILAKIKLPNETMAQFEARLKRLKQEGLQERKRSILKYAAEKKQEWRKGNADLRRGGSRAALLGFLLVAVGAFGSQLRYLRKPASRPDGLPEPPADEGWSRREE